MRARAPRLVRQSAQDRGFASFKRELAVGDKFESTTLEGVGERIEAGALAEIFPGIVPGHWVLFRTIHVAELRL